MKEKEKKELDKNMRLGVGKRNEIEKLNRKEREK